MKDPGLQLLRCLRSQVSPDKGEVDRLLLGSQKAGLKSGAIDCVGTASDPNQKSDLAAAAK